MLYITMTCFHISDDQYSEKMLDLSNERQRPFEYHDIDTRQVTFWTHITSIAEAGRWGQTPK
jgi:hypothetical protein